MELAGKVTLGQYLPLDSSIHRLDPRSKILALILLVVLLFLVSDFRGYLLFLLLTILVLRLSQVPVGYALQGLKPMLPILILMWFFQLFFYPGAEGRVLFSLGPVRATLDGLFFGGLIITRVLFLFFFTTLLTLTTSLMALTDGMESLLKPLTRVGFPAQELAMVMVIALRFVPTLARELERLMGAQMARGVNFKEGNFLQRTKRILPLLLPLFISAFRRGEELILAMESRCYRGGGGRTRLRVLSFSSLDLRAALILVIFLIIFFMLG